MRKVLIIVSILIISCTGCSQFNNDQTSGPQLNLLSYPDQVTAGEEFSVKADYLTKQPDGVEVKVHCTVRKLSNGQGLATEEKTLTNQSQTISFSGLDLANITSEPINTGIYFELKLIINGKFKLVVTTKSDPTLVANRHKEIITTYFKPAYGEQGTEKTAAFGNYLSNENPYYFALPYRPYYNGQVYKDNPDLYGTVKNRWIEIYYPEADPTSDSGEHKYVYAQWEDVGPWNVYDPDYVFGSNEDRPDAESGTDSGWSGEVRETNGAGLDISPAAMSYLTGGTKDNPDAGNIKVSWRFIPAEEVPQGPWKQNVSTKVVAPSKANYNTNTLRTNRR